MLSFRPVYYNRLISVKITIRRISQSNNTNNHNNANQDSQRWTIKTSSALIDRKSKFIGHAWHTRTTEKVEEALENIKTSKSLRKASHPAMYAWRVRRGGNLLEGSSDCGEKGAGQVLLSLLRTAKWEDVLVVVTRFYGGIPLGNDRFRHIRTVANDALSQLRDDSAAD